MSRKNAGGIDVAAAEWAARADRGLLKDEEEALAAWLAGDIRRPGAYARMRAVASHTERARALSPGFHAANFRPPANVFSRRHLMVASGTMAASLIGMGGLGYFWLGQGQEFSTRKGEQRVVPLRDGSVVTLNTASKVAVRFTKNRRDIQLIEGEALFDVAKNPQRPFIVQAGDTEVRAVGTSFTVQSVEGVPVQVLVREGIVDVTRPKLAAQKPLRLIANTRATAASDSASVQAAMISTAELHRAMAWREGRIAFEGDTLEAASAKFARYSDTKIVIADPALAREEIAGVFQANDPVGFARAIAVSLSARVEVGDGEVTISR